jgi:hypothetical protein
LIVKTGDGGGVGEDGAVIIVVVSRVRRAETSAEGGGLLLQGVRLRALLGESVGCSADALLGSSGSLEKVGLLLELLAALSIGGLQGLNFLFQRFGGGKSFITKLGGSGRSGCVRAGVTGGGSAMSAAARGGAWLGRRSRERARVPNRRARALRRRGRKQIRGGEEEEGPGVR